MKPGAQEIAGGRPDRGPREPRRAAVLFLVALWALFAGLYGGASLDERQIYFGGDQADLLRSADETLHGRPPILGAPSREGLFHPGPLFVYLVAAVQGLTSGREALTISTVMVLQATCVLVLSLLTLRLSGSLALAASLPCVLVFNYAFLLYLRLLWNVAIVTPALALAIFLVVSLEPPRPWRLAALAALLSLVAQAHMGFVLVAGWLGAVALAGAILCSPRIRWRDVGPAAGVLAVLWAPVAWDAARHRGGNLARIATRFSAPHEPRTWGEVFAALDALLSETIRGGPTVRVALLAASLGLLGVFSVAGGERARAFRRLFAAVTGSWIVFLLSVRAIPESIQTYYLRPMWVVTGATVMGGASALLSVLRVGRVRTLAGLAIAALAVAASAGPAVEMRRLFADTAWNPLPLDELRAVVSAIAARAGPGELRRADVAFRLEDLAGAESSFRYLLDRRGVRCEASPGAPRLRVARAAERPPEPGWTEVLRSKRFRLEQEKEVVAAGGIEPPTKGL